MFNCGRCRRLVVICRRCDRGNLYCGQHCARIQRRLVVREAGRRYLRTPGGAAANAARQKRWRLRVSTTVTHHTSAAEVRVAQEAPVINGRDGFDATVSTGSDHPPATARAADDRDWRRCDFCGRPCGSFSRLVPLRAARRGAWRVSRRL